MRMRRDLTFKLAAWPDDAHAPDAAFAWLWLSALCLLLLVAGSDVTSGKPPYGQMGVAAMANIVVFCLRLIARSKGLRLRPEAPRAPLSRRYLANVLISAGVAGIVLAGAATVGVCANRTAAGSAPIAAPLLA